MGNGKKYKEQRNRMAERQGWLCFFCQQPMIQVPENIAQLKVPPPNMVTFEHIHSRYNPERGKHGGEKVNVASCVKCNNERNREEEKQLPIEELWKRCGMTQEHIEVLKRRNGANENEV